jgi:hypothetical protein
MSPKRSQDLDTVKGNHMSLLTFVINRYDENGYPVFELPYAKWANVLRSESLHTRILEESQMGSFVIEVAGYKISLVDEMFGLAIEIESEDMPDELARSVMEEIKTNVERATGDSYRLLEMPPDRPYRF